jgi:hypothetical protein
MNSLLRRFLIAIAVLLIGLIAFVFMFLWNVNRKLEAKIDELRQAGKPVTIVELGHSSRFSGNADSLRDLEKPLLALESSIAKVPTTGDEQQDSQLRVAAFRAFEPGEPSLIKQLRQAAADPAGTSGLNFDAPPQVFLNQLLTTLSPYRSAARALSYHADAALADGKTDEAMLDAIAIVRWADQLSHEPAMTGHQVSLAVRGIAIEVAAKCLYRGDASEQLRSELLKVVREHDRAAAWSRMIDSERAIGRSLFDEHAGPGRVLRAAMGDGVELLEAMNAYDAVGQKPAGIDPGQLEAGPMAALLLPAMAATISSHRRVQAKTQALEILAAWQDAGSDPLATIESLGLPTSVTIDPFDGSMLKLKMTATGPVIYSVGQDLADNDGRIEDESDLGLGPP